MRLLVIICVFLIGSLVGLASLNDSGSIRDQELAIAADTRSVYLFGKNSKHATVLLSKIACQKPAGIWPYDDYIVGVRQYFQRLGKNGKPMETYVILLESKSDPSLSVPLIATSSPSTGDGKQIRLSLKEGKKLFESLQVGVRAYICPTLPQFD